MDSNGCPGCVITGIVRAAGALIAIFAGEVFQYA